MDYADLLGIAYQYAKWYSEDRSTHCGALLFDPVNYKVKALGTNRFPSETLKLDERNHERPRKYSFTEHAERAVIFNCARQGIKTQGLIMAAPWACCADCARAIKLAGISLVVAHKQAYDRSPERWKTSISDGLEILRQGGVIYHLWDGKVGQLFEREPITNLFDGEVWYP